MATWHFPQEPVTVYRMLAKCYALLKLNFAKYRPNLIFIDYIKYIPIISVFVLERQFQSTNNNYLHHVHIARKTWKKKLWKFYCPGERVHKESKQPSTGIQSLPQVEFSLKKKIFMNLHEQMHLSQPLPISVKNYYHNYYY